MSTAPFAQTVLIQQALIDAFTATQSPSGALSSVAAIGETTFNETGLYPYLSVEWIHTKEDFVAVRKVRITCTFGISISCRSTTLLVDAKRQRDRLIDDGQGGGLQPILRNIMTTTFLGGLIEMSHIVETISLSSVQADKGQAQTEYFSDGTTIFEAAATITV